MWLSISSSLLCLFFDSLKCSISLLSLLPFGKICPAFTWHLIKNALHRFSCRWTWPCSALCAPWDVDAKMWKTCWMNFIRICIEQKTTNRALGTEWRWNMAKALKSSENISAAFNIFERTARESHFRIHLTRCGDDAFSVRLIRTHIIIFHLEKEEARFSLFILFYGRPLCAVRRGAMRRTLRIVTTN